MFIAVQFMELPKSSEKPCRACMSVEELMRRARELASKVKAKTDTSNGASSSNDKKQEKMVEEGKPMRADCPLDTEQLGKSTWNFLHTMAAYYPEKPSEEDKNNARIMMHLLGKNREEFSIWMCEMHNRVSRKLGKAEFDCSLWKQRWLDGWKDGSCDY
uniref:Sulfhydryl oxidase n=1 Tax=Parascaris equorum TaxID=6256 RepID=A0A914RRW4_PAREQ